MLLHAVLLLFTLVISLCCLRHGSVCSELLDRESHSLLTLTATVSDGVALDTAQVLVHITDVNDELPTFSLSVYSFPPVNETAKVGQAVGQVTAFDADSGPNGQIRFRIIQGGDG